MLLELAVYTGLGLFEVTMDLTEMTDGTVVVCWCWVVLLASKLLAARMLEITADLGVDSDPLLILVLVLPVNTGPSGMDDAVTTVVCLAALICGSHDEVEMVLLTFEEVELLTNLLLLLLLTTLSRLLTSDKMPESATVTRNMYDTTDNLIVADIFLLGFEIQNLSSSRRQ